MAQGQVSKLQVSFSFSDGFSREIQRKSQAEPGPLVDNGPTVTPRWVGSGWVIYNNKGKPVRQYEPFFDSTYDFAFGAAVGVSSTLFYDPLLRVVATLNPNQAWEKVVFDPWRQDTWDSNDTVLIADPSLDADVGTYFARLPRADYFPTWYGQRINDSALPFEQAAAQKAAVHANTPTTAQLDSLRRTFLTLAYNRYLSGTTPVEGHYRTFLALDVEGNQRSITDALGRMVMTYDYDMLSKQIHRSSVDSGDRWLLSDVLGKALLSWNSRGFQIQRTYDAARRPTGLYSQSGGGANLLAELTVYGESQPNAQAMNLCGRVYQQFDAAGIVTNVSYDFKGNLLTSSRELLVDDKDPVDWSQSPQPPLTGEVFTKSSTFDALNRPVTMIAPDGSLVVPAYNEAALLEQINVTLPAAAAATPFVTDIEYNARGQREQINYGNGAQTSYMYNPYTFRLTSLTTTRSTDNATLQALSYTYDPVGNETHIGDAAQQTIYFSNQIVDPSNTLSGNFMRPLRYMEDCRRS